MLPLNHLNRSLPALVHMPKAPATFGIPRSTIYRAAGEGHIEIKKIGRSAYVVSESVLAFIAGLPKATIRPDRSRAA